MAETLSLMDFLQQLQSNPQLRADYAADPTGSLSSHGLGDLSPLDIHDALILIEDTRTADFDGGLGAGVGYGLPPEPSSPDDGTDAAVEYLNRYVAGAGGGHPSLVVDDFADPDLDLPLGPDGTAGADGALTGDDALAGFGEGGSPAGTSVFAFDGGDDLAELDPAFDAGADAYASQFSAQYPDLPDIPPAGPAYPDDLPYDGFGAGADGPADTGPASTDLPDS